MKHYLTLFFLLVVLTVTGQDKATVAPTMEIQISGRVRSSRIVTLNDLVELKRHHLGDVLITNHAGEPRGTARQLEGVALTDVISLASLDNQSPKELSAYFFVCRAQDGYTVVFSWNELFNTPVGDQVMIVVEKDGVALSSMPERILLISPSDRRTGRRYVKGLAAIEVNRSE